MKKLSVLIAMVFCMSAKAQFNSKQYFKHNEIDGWIKITETEWFTVAQSGDTTFFSQTTEETNQADPNIKPKYIIDGLGNIEKPVPVKQPDVVQYATKAVYLNKPAQVVCDTIFSIDTFKITNNKVTSKTKYRTKNKYKTRYKNRKPVKEAKPVIKKVPVAKINVLKYKDNLYMVSCDPYYLLPTKIIQAKTYDKAILLYKNRYQLSDSIKIIATDFDQYDIIKITSQ